jgi:hypothetical protein
MSIKAIETVYKGYKFRSRLEARWAVFLDSLNVNYEYEPEGYQCDNLYYLPDFKVKCCGLRGSCDIGESFDLFIEVKPRTNISFEESEKIKMLAHGGYPVLIVTDIPNVQSNSDCIDSLLFGTYENLGFRTYAFNLELIDGDHFGAYPSADENGNFYLMGDEQSYLIEKDCQRVIKAYQKARQAQFEHGVKGYK